MNLQTIFLQANPTQEMLPTILMFGLMFVVFYFFMIRPQMKKQKEEQLFQSSIKKGDRIVTTAGIHGKIVDLPEGAVVVETGAGKIKFEREAISQELTAARYSK